MPNSNAISVHVDVETQDSSSLSDLNVSFPRLSFRSVTIDSGALAALEDIDSAEGPVTVPATVHATVNQDGSRGYVLTVPSTPEEHRNG